MVIRRQIVTWGGLLGGVGLAIGLPKLLRVQQSTASMPVAPGPIVPAAPEVSSTAATGSAVFNPPKGDLRLAVISDLNSQYGSTTYEPEVDRAIELMSLWQPNWVLCGGDMVAGQKSSLTVDQIQAMWSAFDRHVSAPLRQAGIPYGFTLGNHDASSARSRQGFLFAQERELAAAYWNDPRHDPGLQFVDRSHFPFYYSFQVQRPDPQPDPQPSVFCLVWDASSATISAEQIAWVEQSLSSPIAQAANLRLAIGHLPLYGIAIGRDQPGEYLDNAADLQALLERYQVHTYISGHDHAYFPGHQGQLELLHCGLLGTGARTLLNGNVPPMKTVTIVDFTFSPLAWRYTTYNATTLEVVQLERLPRLIATRNGQVLRQDVQAADLTPAERSIEYVPRS